MMGRREAVILLAAAAIAGCGEGSYNLDGGDELVVGQAFVQQRGCPSCHQSANAADGVLSGQTTPQPGTSAYGSNLTPDVTTGLGAWADIEIVRAMRDGLDNQQMTLCPTMTRYPDMTDLEANAIVAYLRSLTPVSRTIPGSMCPPIKPPPPADMAVPPTPAVDMASSDGGAP
jgi:hypothetical protein